ncbi:MAG: DNA photolyase [Desulfobacteraceae bacterium]|nr:DNA photolyase [Desulfobacteraceae bacterium]
MIRRAPGRVIVESEVAGGSLVASLRANLPHAVFETVDRVSEQPCRDPGVLEVVRFRGRFLKSCPGTRHYHCCGYRILHFGTQCTLECSYCILQAYLNQPNLRLFGNIDDMLGELSADLEENSGRLHRIGTGEFTDSMLLDPYTGLSRLLVPFFAKTPNAVLELKTKTDFIGNLDGLEHNGHTIAAWSLNAEHVRRREEPFAATLKERLNAARFCAERGYYLAFHFDPIIEHPDWRSGYGEVLDRLFDAVDPSRIVWMSLGAFRFMPELKSIIQEHHGRSRIPYGEFIRGLDGKMRYFRDIRVEFYSFMINKIRRADPHLCAYLCMEGDDIWLESFGFSPRERGGLDRMLDHAVRDRMHIDITAPETQPFV